MFPHQTSVHQQTASRLETPSFLTQSSSPSAAPSSFPRSHADLAIVVPPSASGLHVKLSVEAVKRGDTPTSPQPSFPRSLHQHDDCRISGMYVCVRGAKKCVFGWHLSPNPEFSLFRGKIQIYTTLTPLFL